MAPAPARTPRRIAEEMAGAVSIRMRVGAELHRAAVLGQDPTHEALRFLDAEDRVRELCEELRAATGDKA